MSDDIDLKDFAENVTEPEVPVTPEEDEAWALAMGEKPKAGPAPEKKEEPKPEGEPEPAKEEAKEEPKPAEPKPDDDKARLEKMVRDNQAWATRLAQENADLKKRIEAQKPLEAPKPEPVALDVAALPDDAKRFLTDFPEARAALEHVARITRETVLKEMDAKVSQQLAVIPQLQQFIGQQQFMQELVSGAVDETGARVPGHTDAVEIVNSPEFQNWLVETGRNPEMRSVQAIKAIGEYKKQAAALATSAHDKAAREKAARLKEAAGGALPNDKRKTTGVSKDDLEDAWDLAVNGKR